MEPTAAKGSVAIKERRRKANSVEIDTLDYTEGAELTDPEPTRRRVATKKGKANDNNYFLTEEGGLVVAYGKWMLTYKPVWTLWAMERAWPSFSDWPMGRWL